MKPFTRITVGPSQMGGLPCIRSLRIPVATVVGMVGEGMAETEILNAYPAPGGRGCSRSIALRG